jgi:hypothetical protein
MDLSLDIREGLLYWLTKIELSGGKFIPWVKPPSFTWFLNYQEEKVPEGTDKYGPGGAFDQIRKAKISKFPPKVQTLLQQVQ